MVVVIICIKTSKLTAVLELGLLPAAQETLLLGCGRSLPAGAAHGAAAPLLAPRPFKLPGFPPSPPPPTHTASRSLSVFTAPSLHPSENLSPLPPEQPTPPRSVGRMDGCGC